MGKLTLAVYHLSDCGGCNVQMLRAVTGDEELMEMYDIVYWPMFVEETEPPEKVDVAVVLGAVRTKEHLEEARRARFAAKRVVAVGACAAWGGIVGAADYFPTKLNMKAVYGVERLPSAVELLPRVYAVTDIIPVDYIVTRCPPLVPVIRKVLKAAAKGEPVESEYASASVCSQCPRQMVPIEWGKVEWKLGLPGPEAKPDICLLSQGYLCLGSVTVAGCGAPCTREGRPCFGCGGPARDIALRRDFDVVSCLARRIAALAGLDPAHDLDKVIKMLEEKYGLRRFYVFTMASEVLRGKPQGFAVRALAETRKNAREAEKLLIEKRREFEE